MLFALLKLEWPTFHRKYSSSYGWPTRKVVSCVWWTKWFKNPWLLQCQIALFWNVGFALQDSDSFVVEKINISVADSVDRIINCLAKTRKIEKWTNTDLKHYPKITAYNLHIERFIASTCCKIINIYSLILRCSLRITWSLNSWCTGVYWEYFWRTCFNLREFVGIYFLTVNSKFPF